MYKAFFIEIVGKIKCVINLYLISYFNIGSDENWMVHSLYIGSYFFSSY